VRSSERARGAALIVALLVVATVVVLATAVSGDFLLMFRRVENQLHSEQAHAYLLGAEGVARAALMKDYADAKSRDVDTLAEEWARPQRFPTDYGWIAGQLDDLQGRFNLNLLGTGGAVGADGNIDSEQRRLFVRLLQTLPLETPLAPDQVEALTDAITDWIDENDTVSGIGGAESQHYADADTPGRPANGTIKSPSEIMWVRGMTPAIYRALAPLVTVWPAAAKTNASININTAPPAILRSVNAQNDLQPLDVQVVERIVEQRKAQGSIETDVFRDTAGVENAETGLLGKKSSYFELTAQTEFEGRRYTLHSVIHRDETKKTIRVVARTFGEW
jgi:general secretion pathway protein K